MRPAAEGSGIHGARFEGSLCTEWLVHAGPDRRMRLTQDFAFVDPRGQRWRAPAGSVIDGRNLPRVLSAVAGSPYTGDHRRASVLYNVACLEKSSPSKAVHRMFYEAMLCDGVDRNLALEFYVAARLFGPDWYAKEQSSAFDDVELPAQRSIDEVEAALDALLGE
jgi:hypothetical protein